MMKQDQLATPLKLTTLYNRFLWTFLITGLVLVTVQENVERSLDLVEHHVTNLRRARDVLSHIHTLFIILCYCWMSYVVYKANLSPYWMTSACLSLAAVSGLMEVNVVPQELPATLVVDIEANTTRDASSQCNSNLIFDSDYPTQSYSLLEVVWDSSVLTTVVVRAFLSFGTAVYCLMGLVVIDNLADGTLTPLLLAILLIIQTGFPSFIQLLSSIVSIATDSTADVGGSKWIGAWDRGWIPLGLGSLFLAFLYPLCIPVRSSYSLVSFALKRHQQITSQQQQRPAGSANGDIRAGVHIVETRMKESENESKEIENVTDREERGERHENNDTHVNVGEDLSAANDTIGVNNGDVDAHDDEETGTDGAELTSKDFFTSLMKLLRNRIFLLNALSDLLIVAALLGVDQLQAKLSPNLKFADGVIVDTIDTGGGGGLEDELEERSTLRSWFQFSEYLNAIGQSVTLLITGCVVAKAHPKARKLTAWKIMTLLFMISFVVMFMRDFNQSGGESRNFKFNLKASPATCKTLRHMTIRQQQTPVSSSESLKQKTNPSSESQVQQDSGSMRSLVQQLPLFPICSDKDRLLFLSSCEAGCRQKCAGPNRTQFFTNCSSLSNGSEVLSPHLCPDSSLTQMVWLLYIFIVIKCVLITTRVIGIFMSIRCVPSEDRVLGLGVVLGLSTLIPMWDQENFALSHLIELAVLSLITTSLLWYLLENLPLYHSIESSNISDPTISHDSLGSNNKASRTSRRGDVNASPREHITMLPRASIDEMAMLDVRMMSKQRDSIDVTKFKMNRFKAVGKRFSIDYRKRSLPRCKEHVVYP